MVNIDVKKILVPPASCTDQELIEKIRGGDVNAYGSMMRRYNQSVFRIARSFVRDDSAAMDIVQESHIKAFTKIHTFEGRSSFFAWLATITRNEALMYLRKRKREEGIEAKEVERCDPKTLPDEMIRNKEIQTLISQYVDELPEHFRTVFILRGVEELSVRETAQILEIKEETVKTRYFRAKKLLKEKIQNFLDSAGISVYEFGGEHCNKIIIHVLEGLFH